MANVTTNELINIFKHCVSAVLPQKLIRKSIQYNSKTQRLTVVDKIYNLQNKNVYVVGTGKAVLKMAKETEAVLGSKIKRGIVSVPVGTIENDILENISYFEGAENNLPDTRAELTAKKVKELIINLGQGDLLLVLISGGGSALLPLPCEHITLDEKLLIIKYLANAGADIKELNTVRKKLSELKGGRLALLSQPAQVISLILSDIVGDPIDLIASGPTSKNEDHPLKAMEVMKKYNLYNNLTDTIKNVLHQKIEDMEFPLNNVSNYIIGSNKLSIEAAVQQARRFDYFPIEISSTVTGNIKTVATEYVKLTTFICEVISKKITLDLGRDQLKNIHIPHMKIDWLDEINNFENKKLCLILGGETTVEVKGTGKGGRNQQLALEFSKRIHDNKNKVESFDIYFLSAGTDGIDGPTDAAGAIGYLDLITDSLEDGIAVDQFLNSNDSYNFYRKFKNGAFHVVTGHTTTNVMDIHLIVIIKKD